jgi:hypothetical protein
MDLAQRTKFTLVLLLFLAITSPLAMESLNNVSEDRSSPNGERHLTGIDIPTCTFDETLQLLSGNLTCVPVNCTAKYIGLRKVFNPVVRGVLSRFSRV